MFGVFLTPSTGGTPDGNMDTSFESFNFNLDWKPQIDASIAIGANCISFFGSVSAITPNGSISLSAYIASLKTICDYLQAAGVYFLPYLADTFTGWRVGVTDNQAATIIAAACDLLRTYSKCIGCVTVDEPFAGPVNTSGPLVARIASAYNATATARAANPNFLVCGCPNPCGNVAGNLVWLYSGQGKTNFDSVEAYCDFYNFHAFYAGVLSDSDILRQAFPSKKIVMGSAVNQTGDSQAATVITALDALVGANNFWLVNVFLALDFDANAFGLFNSDLSDRTTRTNAFTAGIHAYVPRQTISLVAHVQKNNSPNGGTSLAIDTTGATFLAIHSSQYFPGGLVSPTDSKGNTWRRRTPEPDGSSSVYSCIWDCKNPTVGPGHTFTISGAGIYDTSCMAAFSNVVSASEPFILEASAATDNSFTATSVQLGNIDPPTSDFNLVLTGLAFDDNSIATVNQGFTIIDQAPLIGGQSFGGAFAYKVEGISNTENPTWGWANGSVAATTGAAYYAKPS